MTINKNIFRKCNLPGSSKRLAGLIFLCLFRVSLFAQDSSFSSILMTAFNRYSSRHLPEKCFVHTDKNDYLAGEIIWFKVYDVDGYYNKPLSLSKVIYAELLDAENNPVLQGKIALVNGDADGSFDIPDTLSGGWYRFRAYTNWMKNAGPDYFFEKDLRIFNARETLSKTGGYAANPFRTHAADSAINPSGYTMRIEKKNDGGTEAIVTPPPGSVKGNDSLWLFAQAHGIPAFCIGVKSDKGDVRFRFKEQSLGTGLVQLTLFDAKKKPVSETLLFVPPAQQMKISLSNSQSLLHTRDAVSVAVETSDEKENPLAADLSVSVYRTDSLSSPERISMPDYYWLESELPRATLFNGMSSGRPVAASSSAADSLLLLRKWSRFNWQEILDTTPREPLYAPETRDPVISGKVVSAADGKPAPRIYAYASVAGKQTLFRSAESDAAGIVRFEMPGFTGNNQLIVQTAKEDSAYRVELISPFSDQFRQRTLPTGTTAKGVTPGLAERLFNEQIENVYQADSIQQWEPPLAPGAFFYGKPDYRYHLDDYKRFTTMEEVMREYVKTCNVFRSEGVVKLVLQNLPAGRLFTDPPLVLLDGIPVFDEGRPMNFDPLKISDIELVNREYLLGPQKYSGIINCLTYHGDLAGFVLPAQATTAEYEGLQLKRKFYTPVYATTVARNSRVPDYRTLLYWNPSLHTGTGGKTQITFYVSDIPGRYTVVVHGITANGVSGSRTMEFTVTRADNK